MPSRTAAADLPPEPTPHTSNEEAVTRWATWYEALPDDLRTALDERGRHQTNDPSER